VGDRWGTGRIEAFSDGVFAIAITLLILEVAVPKSDFDNLWRGIAHQWPAYLAYATSFITIGGIWLVHHGIFRRLEYTNSWVMRINLGPLMAVAFLPFPTRLLAEAIHDRDAERAAVIFYGAMLLVISLLFSARGKARDHVQGNAPRFCGIPSKWNIERQLIVAEEDAALTSIGSRECDESLHLARGPNFEFHARSIGPYLPAQSVVG
jgi:uncharacterized membrane protein